MRPHEPRKRRGAVLVSRLDTTANYCFQCVILSCLAMFNHQHRGMFVFLPGIMVRKMQPQQPLGFHWLHLRGTNHGSSDGPTRRGGRAHSPLQNPHQATCHMTYMCAALVGLLRGHKKRNNFSKNKKKEKKETKKKGQTEKSKKRKKTETKKEKKRKEKKKLERTNEKKRNEIKKKKRKNKTQRKRTSSKS